MRQNIKLSWLNEQHRGTGWLRVSRSFLSKGFEFKLHHKYKYEDKRLCAPRVQYMVHARV